MKGRCEVSGFYIFGYARDKEHYRGKETFEPKYSITNEPRNSFNIPLISMKDAREAINRRENKIARLKKRIAELERPDMFLDCRNGDEWIWSFGEALSSATDENTKLLVPRKIARAVRLTDVWAVLEKETDEFGEAFNIHEFNSRNQAERFCKKARGKENKGDAE